MVLPGKSLDEYVGTYELAEKFLLYVRRINDGLLHPGHRTRCVPDFSVGAQ